jgi:hypothetical protein
MTKVLLLLAVVGCALILASAIWPKLPVWVGAFILGLAVVIPLALQVWR